MRSIVTGCGYWFVLVLVTQGCAPAADDGEASQPVDALEDELYLALDATLLWHDNGLEVPVCWLPNTAVAQQALLTEALTNGWQAETSLRFTGFTECPTSGSQRFVRVEMNPNAPGANVATGSFSVGVNGALRAPDQGRSGDLSFSPDVTPAKFKQLVLHEFGHVLGFGHEMHRKDATGCPAYGFAPGVLAGPYDPFSVMSWSYCHSNENGLTQTDKANARFIYGPPRGAPEVAFLPGRFNNRAHEQIVQAYRGWHSLPKCDLPSLSANCRNDAATIHDSGSPEQKFVVGDFDGDGHDDVAQTYRRWASIPLCRSNLTSWQCTNDAADTYDSGSAEQFFLAANFDGLPGDEIVIAHRRWLTMPVCKWSSGGWECDNTPAIFHHDGHGQRYLVGRFDRDNRDDIAIVHPAQTKLAICLARQGSWQCNERPIINFSGASLEQQFAVGDFDGDGLSDVIETHREWQTMPVYRFRDDGSVVSSNLPAQIYNANSTEQRFLTGDVNGDGRVDVIQTYRGWNSLPTCLSTGTGWSCSNAPATIIHSGSSEQRFLAADINGDNRTDVVQAHRLWNYYEVCLSTSSGMNVSWQCTKVPATVWSP